MSAFGKYLRMTEGGTVLFWCPGCKEVHQVRIGEGHGPRWGFNNDPERPTFTPSVLVTSGHFIAGHAGACWCTYNKEQTEKGKEPSNFKCHQCHTFITDGHIQFLGDCSHDLAGQTLPLQEFPSKHQY